MAGVLLAWVLREQARVRMARAQVRVALVVAESG